MLPPPADVYSAREIARAAGVATADAVAAIGRPDALLAWPDAVRVARALARRDQAAAVAAAPRPLFAAVSGRGGLMDGTPGPLALSSSLHVGAVAAFILVTSFGLTPRAASLSPSERVAEPMRLVFVATPGPGGGGGGGGALQKPAPPKALSEGRHAISSPLPRREPPKRIAPVPAPPEPKPIDAEQLPVVVAPIVAAPADPRSRPGVLAQSDAQADSRGPGRDGGVGTGNGTGIGEGDGTGIGPGSGGGTGGGPYRPGSGIEPPRLLREVRADYTEDARRRGVEGDVVLEIVVRRDGSVGDIRVLQGLDDGLNDRAVAAVRQWRFAPARRLNAPVDVIVEVSVEFKLR